MKNKELTKAEEQLMQYLWEMRKGFLGDIVERFPEPRPAYTTVSTVIGVLVRKGFIGFNVYGKTREYFPLVSKPAYFRGHLKSIIDNFFNGSNPEFASFFTDEKMDVTELEQIKRMIEQKIDDINSRGNE